MGQEAAPHEGGTEILLEVGLCLVLRKPHLEVVDNSPKE